MLYFKGIIKSTVFLKLFMAFALIISPLYLFSININMGASKDIQESIINSTQSKISFLVNTIEKEFNNAMTRQRELINDKELKMITVDRHIYTEYELNTSASVLRTRLEQIVDSNAYVESMSIYLPDLGKTICSTGIREYTTEDRVFFGEAVDPSIYRLPFMERDNELYANFMPLSTTGSFPIYLVSIKVSKASLRNTLREFLSYESGGVFLTSFSSGLDIYEKSEEEMFTKLSKFIEDNDVEESFTWNDKKQYFIIVEKSNDLGTTFLAYFHQEQLFNQLLKYVNWFWYLSIYAISLVIVFALIVNWIVARPLSKLMNGLSEVIDGNLNVELKYGSNDEFGSVYSTFNTILDKMRQTIEQVYELKIRTQSAELKQLQYQINPHFLYNSIFAIYRMAKFEDYEAIMHFSEHLGSFYRYITRGGMENDTTLLEEVTHVKNYIEVQKVRYGERIKVEFSEIPNGFENMPVPKLIFEPLVENAYEHALEGSTSGMLRISMDTERNAFIIKVEDNGTNVSDETIENIQSLLSRQNNGTEITGVLNVHRRISIRFGGKSGLMVARSELGGMLAKIQIEGK